MTFENPTPHCRGYFSTWAEHCRPGRSEQPVSGARLCTGKGKSWKWRLWKEELTSSMDQEGSLVLSVFVIGAKGVFLAVHESFPAGAVLQPPLYSGSRGCCVSQHPLLLLPLAPTASILLLSAATGVSSSFPVPQAPSCPVQPHPVVSALPSDHGRDPPASPSQTLLKEWLNHRAQRSQPTATVPLATGKQTARLSPA